jgi:hypothetical protein|tara:strand:+ start:56 stop:253 length:198 start_codon:yes stop_codon:yes gene_type:complete
MNGSFDILKEEIKRMKKEVEFYKKRFEVQQDRSDEWMVLYMELEKENEKLKELIKPKKKSTDENN